MAFKSQILVVIWLDKREGAAEYSTSLHQDVRALLCTVTLFGSILPHGWYLCSWCCAEQSGEEAAARDGEMDGCVYE